MEVGPGHHGLFRSQGKGILYRLHGLTSVAHLLTTGVEGLTVTSNREYAVILKSLMNHGRDSIYLSIDDDKR